MPLHKTAALNFRVANVTEQPPPRAARLGGGHLQAWGQRARICARILAAGGSLFTSAAAAVAVILNNFPCITYLQCLSCAILRRAVGRRLLSPRQCMSRRAGPAVFRPDRGCVPPSTCNRARLIIKQRSCAAAADCSSSMRLQARAQGPARPHSCGSRSFSSAPDPIIRPFHPSQ
jgi:hypothetical protein